MPTATLTILAVLWVAWAAQAALSVLLVRKFARGFDRPPREAYETYRPPVALIVPFKGLDLGLRDHLRALCSQEYPDYHLVFVVESEDDAACPVIRDEITRCTHPAELIVAGLAGPDEGQKVHNLCAAVEHLQRHSRGETVWAFADSDAATGPHWLAALVGPLALERTGVATGYRWFVPAANAPVWSHVASVMNSSVACWAGRDEYNHAWGGSMAVRVETAQRGDLLAHWRGSLSDDYQITRMCRSLGLRIYFVHRCLVASPADFGFRELWRFARRQYIITRTHAPALYAAALAMQTLYVAGFVSACAALLWFLVARPGDVVALAPLAAIVIVAGADRLRSRYRRRVVARAFGGDAVRRLHTALRIDAHLTPLWMALHWLIVLSAAASRTIAWRGNRYRIHAPQRIRKLTTTKRTRVK